MGLMDSLTPAMRQYVAIKKNFPDCVLFFRMGDFYEMFFEDAKTASRALNIALTSRSKDKNLPMCGIPYHALETYLARMVKGGHKVAICEQVEDPKTAKGVVKREVVRVVTPGTITEDFLLDEKSPSLLAAVFADKDSIGLSTADLSTGRFTTREFGGDKRFSSLIDELARLAPKEIVVPGNESDNEANGLSPLLKNSDIVFEEIDEFAFDGEEARRRLTAHLGVTTLEGFGITDDDAASASVSAAGAALYYIQRNSPKAAKSINTLQKIGAEGEMEIDSASLKNLEIVANLADGAREGSLLEILDRTKTAMGARLLRERIVKPLNDKDAIQKRQDAVTAFFNDSVARGKLRNVLGEIPDFERAAGRIAGGNFNPRDFSSLLNSLERLPDAHDAALSVNSEPLNSILNSWDNAEELKDLLERAVNRAHPATFKAIGFIREGYDAKLDEIRSLGSSSRETIKKMEKSERASMKIPTLKIGYNKIYGYYIEVTKKHAEKVPQNYIRKQSLVNCERFVSPELKEIEEKLATAEEKAHELESSLIDELRGKVVDDIDRVRTAAFAVAALDVASALAETAKLHDYCPPKIARGRELRLAESRHPVIERMMTEENFVPNDISIDETSPHLLIVTGPNMAGKSTYLRQVALAVLMAQMGGYVAARSAVIGIADRIFTRVGAQDRLQKGLSTFMVEMVETANILNNATDRSVVILDEIGRGTSTFDGISIAWAVAEFLARKGARTIFATHYHELTDLAATEPHVANFNITAREYKDRLVFLRKIEPGPADKSYGIQVAKLAGLPDETLKRARQVLRKLEKMEFGADGKPQLKAEGAEDESQLSFFDVRGHPVFDALKDADPDNMKPIDAINFLQKLKEMLD